MNAVERVLHYAELPPEENRTISNGKQPPPSWPDKGVIQFTNVKMYYRKGLPLVLKGINISIQPGEKVIASRYINCSVLSEHTN
jgi:ABC-type multidrug transport system fused ATPase/permease subunit